MTVLWEETTFCSKWWIGLRQNIPRPTLFSREKAAGDLMLKIRHLWAEMKEKANAVIIGMGH